MFLLEKKGRVFGTAIFITILSFVLAYSAVAQALLQTGMQAPEFSLLDLEGKEHSLSHYSQKKALVIVFWSTWSANSPKALKRFETFYEAYKDKGIQVLAINSENQTISADDVETIKRKVKELEVSFPVLLDKNLSVFRGYSTIALPSTVVITGGKITYELPGFPLVATEDMFDYLAVLAGDQPKKQSAPKYMPRHDVIADTNLARGFVKKKLYGMAYPFFTKAIEKDPKYMLPYVELSRLYEIEHKNEEAESTLKKALALEPENVVVLSELGYLKCKIGKIKECIEILDKAAKLNSYTPSHYLLAYALGLDGKTKEAFDAFDKAVSLNPFESMIYILRAEIYEKNKMLKEASADYRKALELMLDTKN